jgi:hypothetical protein
VISCQHGNEPIVSIKDVKLIDYMSDCELIKDSVQRSQSVHPDLYSLASSDNSVIPNCANPTASHRQNVKNRGFTNSFTGAYSPGWTFGLPFRGFLITHTHTDTRQDSSGRVISPSQRPMPTQDKTTYKPCPDRDSKPEPQQPCDSKPTPLTARPLGSAKNRGYVPKAYFSMVIFVTVILILLI